MVSDMALNKVMIWTIRLCLLGGFLVFATGCGRQEPPSATTTEPTPLRTPPANASETAFTPEEILAAYRASAEALELRDESNPSLGTYLYIDEATELLYRLSVHGIDPALLPEVGTIFKRTTDDGDPMIEATIHADAAIWIEAVSVLSGTRAKQEAATEERIRQLKDAFAKELQKPRAP